MTIEIAKVVCLGVVLAFFSGCGGTSTQLSGEAERIKADVNALCDRMTSSGNSVWLSGDGIVRRIQALPEDERSVLAMFYVGAVESLGTAVVAVEELPVWLYNLQGLLKTVDLFADDLADKKRLLRLYELCLDRYHEGIRLCRKLAQKEKTPSMKRRYLDKCRDLETGCCLYFATVRKIYLPLVAARILPEDQYEQWKGEVEEKMKKLPREESR